MSESRQTAFDALIKTERQGGFSNLTLDSVLSKTNLDTRDRSFVSNIFYGVIERKITIDYQLEQYLSKPLKKLKPEVLVILRMGAYQILFMDKVPDRAAVNESVKLSRKNGCSFASSLINAVLRKLSLNNIVLPDEKNEMKFLSVKYSCPEWLIDKWFREYGETDTVEMLKSSVGEPPLYIRVNNTLTDATTLSNDLEKQGIKCELTDIENSLMVHFSGNDIEKTDSYKKGLFHVQDLASQICAAALDAKEGQTVFDLCSAPGGKAYTVAETMNNIGKVLCFDIYENRVNLIRNGAERLGLNIISAQTSDASLFNDSIGTADRVLCDVPCSGLGIIRRKPEIKYKDKDDFNDLPDIQYSILKNASRYVKSGGKLLYSTCTLSRAENDEIVDRFLKENNDFSAETFSVGKLRCERITLMPHKNNSDGFFISLFRRK